MDLDVTLYKIEIISQHKSRSVASFNHKFRGLANTFVRITSKYYVFVPNAPNRDDIIIIMYIFSI